MNVDQVLNFQNNGSAYVAKPDNQNVRVFQIKNKTIHRKKKENLKYIYIHYFYF